MPKMIFDSLETLPEEFRPAAARDEESGKFSIDLSLTSKVREFRDNNTQLKTQVESLGGFRQTVAQVYGVDNPDDFDIEKFREDLTGLREIKKQVDDGKLIADSSLESAVETRVQEMKGGYEKQKQEMSRKIDEERKRGDMLQGRMHEYVVQSEITRAVMDPESDVRTDALPDILNRAKGIFKVDQEKLTVVPYDSDGQPLYSGDDPTKIMTTREWLGQQLTSSPYLSKSSKGGGAEGGTNGSTPATKQAGNVPMKDYFAARKQELAANSPQR